MKNVLPLFLGFLLFGLHVIAQKPKRFTVNPGQKVLDIIPKDEVYAYPAFAQGTVYLQNETVGTARLNYNAIISEIQFIDQKGDTISLAEEPEIKFIAVNKDTFYFDKVYVRLIGSYGHVKLASRDVFEISNRQKIGGFGETSSASIETYNKLIVNNSNQVDLVAKEILTLSKFKVLYVGDKFNHFKLANKKNISDLYGKKQKQAQAYLKENTVDFTNKEDVEKLILLLNALD